MEHRLALTHFLLECGDDHLILGHRLSQWCGHAPLLEEDIALANIALDCIGVASLLLEEAGRVEGAGRSADDLAFFRNEIEFRNCLLVEQLNGDFAHTMARQFLFDSYVCLLFESLTNATHQPLAAVAEKALKEATYHCRHSRSWVIRLGDGTEESHTRIRSAFTRLARYTEELFELSPAAEELRDAGVITDLSTLRDPWEQSVAEVLSEATLPPLARNLEYTFRGRDGTHSELLGHLLSEMQSTARAYPGANW